MWFIIISAKCDIIGVFVLLKMYFFPQFARLSSVYLTNHCATGAFWEHLYFVPVCLSVYVPLCTLFVCVCLSANAEASSG